MAKIIYGVAGEGSGHSMRAKEVIKFLMDQGHEVKIFSYDKGLENLSVYFPVQRIFGLRFAYKNNRVQNFRTVWRNILNAGNLIKGWRFYSREIKKFNPDIAITDFEPLTCYLAHYHHLPILSIDNQHQIVNTKIDFPVIYWFDYLISKIVINLIVPRATKYFSISFYNAPLKNENALTFSPIIRSEMQSLVPGEKDYILIYSTSQNTELSEVLKNLPYKFIFYGLNKESMEGNIQYKKFHPVTFLDDLKDCEGVMATSGFTLVSESLQLGKPYLALPIEGQFEQIINALYLEKLGYGLMALKVDGQIIETFISNIDRYKENLRKYPKVGNEKIFKAVEEFIKSHVKKIG